MNILVGVAVLLVGVLVGIFLAGLSPLGMVIYEGEGTLTYEDLEKIPHLSTEGFSLASVDVSENEIYLFSECRRLVMLTNELQTESIRRGIEGELDFRPNSHDVMKNIFDTFGMEPIMVKVTHLSENAYFARLFLVQGTKVLNLDCRPSDAIAIAARTGIPVYVNQTLMEEQGEKVC